MKLSLLSQRLRALLNVCNVYSIRLARSLGRTEAGSLQELNEEEEGEEEDLVSDENQVLPLLSNEVPYRNFVKLVFLNLMKFEDLKIVFLSKKNTLGKQIFYFSPPNHVITKAPLNSLLNVLELMNFK
jgi:hypothetical protein